MLFPRNLTVPRKITSETNLRGGRGDKFNPSRRQRAAVVAALFPQPADDDGELYETRWHLEREWRDLAGSVSKM